MPKETRQNEHATPRTGRKRRIWWIGGGVTAGLLLVVGGVLVYTTYFYRPDISLTQSRIQIEYGDALSLDAKTLLATDDQDICNSTEVDTSALRTKNNQAYPEVGTYTLPVRYIQKRKEQTKELIVDVKDTTKPVFKDFPGDGLEFSVSETKPDYTKYFGVTDLSSVKILVNDAEVDYRQPGKDEVVVTATDAHGNTTSRTVKVTIVRPAVAAPIPAPAPTPTAPVQPMYAKGILIINKKYALPSNYAPGENATAGAAARRMIADMRQQDFNISNSYSGYRSYGHQARLYQGYVALYGQARADTFSARPGHSEHQSGLAFDLLHQNGSLVTGASEASLIATNAHRYGFIVRYQPGKEHITGYSAEPWHLRYIGD